MSTERVLITGATGFVGQYLAPMLSLRGYDVSVTVRTRSQAEHSSYPVKWIGDINGHSDFQESLEDIDYVIHLANRAHVMDANCQQLDDFYDDINAGGTLRLLEACKRARVKRFIYLSSIKVLGETSGDSALSEVSLLNPKDAYARSKVKAENIVSCSGVPAVIIRPPMLYGAHAKGNFPKLVKLIKRFPLLPFGSMHQVRSFVYIENVCDFIERCLTHPKATDEIFNIADVHLSTCGLTKKIAGALDKKIFLWPIPVKLISILCTLIGKRSLVDRLATPLEVKANKAAELLEWRPYVDVDEAFRRSVK